MKKISFVLIMATVFSVVTINCNAQLFLAKIAGGMAVKNVIKHTLFKSSNEANSIEAKEAAKAEKAVAKMNKANFKAAKDFNNQFENQQGAQWWVEDKVICASFLDDNTSTKVVYDRRGNWLYTIANYPEGKMPDDIRKVVKNQYRNYAITNVHEVKEGNETFYIVHLKNGKRYKQLSVYDGEINVMEDFTEA